MSFSKDDLTFGVLIADRLGIALENGELIGQLKAAMQARDEFVSIATHELKTPITVLKGYTQALQGRSGALGDLDRRALAAIDRQTDRLVHLINELLDVSRIQVGRLELRPEEFDLVELCREVVERFAMISENGARARLEAAELTLLGNWDRGHIDQVLTNLVSNALKYSPEGGDVVIRVRREGEEAVVSVTDQGIGIPAVKPARVREVLARGGSVVL
jgi:signal transduction histidine kinase